VFPFLFVELGTRLGMVLKELAGGKLLAVLVGKTLHHVAVPKKTKRKKGGERRGRFRGKKKGDW